MYNSRQKSYTLFEGVRVKILISSQVNQVTIQSAVHFLEAELLYKPLCPSVDLLVGRSVGWSACLSDIQES